MSLKGKVKWFNGNIEYGFIEREDKEKDVFEISDNAKSSVGFRLHDEIYYVYI